MEAITGARQADCAFVELGVLEEDAGGRARDRDCDCSDVGGFDPFAGKDDGTKIFGLNGVRREDVRAGEHVWSGGVFEVVDPVVDDVQTGGGSAGAGKHRMCRKSDG